MNFLRMMPFFVCGIRKPEPYWFVCILSWFVYALVYLGRINFSIALPYLQQEYAYTKTSLGLIASGFFISYAAGQFINGILGDRFNPRHFIAAGLLASGLQNIGFCGLLAGVYAVNNILAAFVPIKFRQERRVSAAAGMIDSALYAGAAVSGPVIGGAAVLVTLTLVDFTRTGRTGVSVTKFRDNGKRCLTPFSARRGDSSCLSAHERLHTAGGKSPHTLFKVPEPLYSCGMEQIEASHEYHH
jgi:hypothetical protein